MAEIDADIAAEFDDLPTLTIAGLEDGDGDLLEIHVKETTEGQGLAAMRLLHQMTSSRSSSEVAGNASRRILDLLFSLIPVPDEQEAVEDALIVGKINLDDLMVLFETGVEEMTGRPTKSSSGSSSRRQPTGQASPVKSQRRVSASKRNASAASAT